MSEIEDRKLNYKHDQPFQAIFSGYVAPAGEMKTESHSVDIGTAELKLACPLPITNPPSTAVSAHTTLNWKSPYFHSCELEPVVNNFNF